MSSPYQILAAAAAKALRYHPPEAPSQWMAREYHLSPQAAPEHPDRINIWRQPLNVGIVDSFLERKRGILVEKCVQSGVSTYMLGLAGYLQARYGGTTFYSLAKEATMRLHALHRLEPLIQRSPELSAIFLPGKDNHETITEKAFLTGTITFASAGSENNFISNAYRWAFADEFDKFGVFPSGRDAFELLKGRQANISDPGLFAFSNPGSLETGIHPHILDESDQRRYHIRCPLCRAVIYLDWDRDVTFDHHPGTDRTIPGTARLLCSACHRPIQDTARYRAIEQAAQLTTPWYCTLNGLTPDPALGWHSMLTPEEAALRPYAGFTGYSHLYHIRKPLVDLDLDYHAALRTEAALRTYRNDILGQASTLRGHVITLTDVEARAAATARHHVPDTTVFITAGLDVQGSTRHLDLIFYFDISAWLPDATKITLTIDRLRATHATAFTQIITYLRDWRGTTATGAAYQIKQIAIDAGYRTQDIYHIANTLSPAGPQWVAPVIYNQEKLGGAQFVPLPQNDKIGDPSRHVYLTSRDFLVGRALERVLAGRVELPAPLPPEVADHYTANIQTESRDRHGNFTGFHWQKRQVAKGQILDDDWAQAGGYAEFAAILLGLDQLAGQQTAAALAAAQDHRADRRAANRSDYHRDRQLQSRVRHQQRNQQRRRR